MYTMSLESSKESKAETALATRQACQAQEALCNAGPLFLFVSTPRCKLDARSRTTHLQPLTVDKCHERVILPGVLCSKPYLLPRIRLYCANGVNNAEIHIQCSNEVRVEDIELTKNQRATTWCGRPVRPNVVCIRPSVITCKICHTTPLTTIPTMRGPRPHTQPQAQPDKLLVK